MITVSDMMSKDLHTLKKSDTLQFARMLMLAKHIHHVPVVDKEGVLLGLVTQRDVLSASHSDVEEPTQENMQKENNLKLAKIMSTDLFCMSPDDSLLKAAEYLLENSRGCIPVVENDKLVGMLTSFDFVTIARDYLKEYG